MKWDFYDKCHGQCRGEVFCPVRLPSVQKKNRTYISCDLFYLVRILANVVSAVGALYCCFSIKVVGALACENPQVGLAP